MSVPTQKSPKSLTVYLYPQRLKDASRDQPSWIVQTLRPFFFPIGRATDCSSRPAANGTRRVHVGRL